MNNQQLKQIYRIVSIILVVVLVFSLIASIFINI
ncbi:Na+-transporting NADH:ubiquinone oxidoreductase subunit NqrC [Herpetosiphon giganteus]|nr:Na+-transporting NADH:ubiquinone oxidoreductase subunit NqrC [Herpetosiphon giganteus]